MVRQPRQDAHAVDYCMDIHDFILVDGIARAEQFRTGTRALVQVSRRRDRVEAAFTSPCLLASIVSRLHLA